MKKQLSTKVKYSLAILALSISTANAEINFPIPDAPKLDAQAYILIDANSGEILADENAETRRDPASLTKMMTSYVVGEAIKSNRISENDIVTISKDAWATGNPVLKGSSLMFLKPGDQVSVADLNKGIIIQSGNDACIAMAEHVAGSQDSFVNLMNNYAQQLGLTDTHFETVHGLDAPGQYTTAKDMAFLGRALIKNLPQEYAVYKEKEFKFNNIKQTNRNGLLWDTSLNVDGIKTGHTNAAGYNLVGSAVEGNTRLISVVLGGRTFKGREEESKKLLTWGFRFFETAVPVKANKPVVSETIWYGDSNSLPLGSLDDVYVTVPRGQAADLNVTYQLNDAYLSAPLEKGAVVGNIEFTLNDKVIAQKPLVTLEAVKETGFFGRIWDYIKLKFHLWFS
ncbi:penicillin-binding protein 6 [Orbus hercynius]|uniref:serine-type D-Ala-D-Ala carboxypeptidase n=1 Tax=Orbus hercynius TaxID=593135 RepID=A0A495RE23_9GAMM|nr:serine hydrolase [Orbus hercynius]RKS85727.1 penicillin-binding protein 6 [Orbus hercynius]